MGKRAKLRDRILAGGSDSSVDFAQLCQLLIRVAFKERLKVGHHILTRECIDERVNL